MRILTTTHATTACIAAPPGTLAPQAKFFYRTTPKLHTITYNGLPDRLAGPPSWATRWACRTARSLPDRLPDRRMHEADDNKERIAELIVVALQIEVTIKQLRCSILKGIILQLFRETKEIRLKFYRVPIEATETRC